MTKEAAKKALLEGRTDLAIAHLRDLQLGMEEERVLSLIEADFSNFQRTSIGGLLTEEQKRLEINRINDQLLSLLALDQSATTKPLRKWWWIGVAGLLLGCCLAYFFWPNTDTDCPAFDNSAKNQILLLPFIPLGENISQPHLLLRDRIEALSLKNGLANSVAIHDETVAVGILEARELAQNCGANIVVWGQYLQETDSISVILQYQFLDEPNWSELGQLSKLKDVTAIQRGEISKGLEDAIFALCGIIAIHEGKAETATQWLEKVKQKDKTELTLLGLMRE